MPTEIQDEYAYALDKLTNALKGSYEKMKLRCLADSEFDYSQAITNRLRAFYRSQFEAKTFLAKGTAQAGSDFFVETILFFLRLFNDVKNLGLEIRSEERILPHLRADITVWSGSELLAVIECKTQLGWHRNTWDAHFKERESKIKNKFPKVQVFLVVMSGCNWSGFKKNDKRVGKQLFCLLSKDNWPTFLPEVYDKTVLETPIEKLFDQIDHRL